MRADIVIGLAHGDECKGATVQKLAIDNGAEVVVRFNGGVQAGHNVVLPDGTHHEFRQFGSATFEGVPTFMSRHTVVYPDHMVLEARDLTPKLGSAPWDMMTVDPRAALGTPFHAAANQARELERDLRAGTLRGGTKRHGSTGYGVWEAECDRRAGLGLTVGDVRDMTESELAEALDGLRRIKFSQLLNSGIAPGDHRDRGHVSVLYDVNEAGKLAELYKIWASLVRIAEGMPSVGYAVFEGAQGVLLDENLGDVPHVTGSTTTARNAMQVLGEHTKWTGEWTGDHRVVGCLRTYATRHGAGPLPTESAAVDFPEPHNVDGAWQQGFRQGWTDLDAVRRATRIQPVDALAVSHHDRTRGLGLGEWMLMDNGEWMEDFPPELLPQALSRAARAPLLYVADGPTHQHRGRYL